MSFTREHLDRVNHCAHLAYARIDGDRTFLSHDPVTPSFYKSSAQIRLIHPERLEYAQLLVVQIGIERRIETGNGYLRNRRHLVDEFSER